MATTKLKVSSVSDMIINKAVFLSPQLSKMEVIELEGPERNVRFRIQVPRAAANPKRRQREAARELRGKGPSTKARQALAEEREALARGRSAEARARREREKRERFEQRMLEHLPYF